MYKSREEYEQMRDFVLKAESLFLKTKNYYGCEVWEQ